MLNDSKTATLLSGLLKPDRTNDGPVLVFDLGGEDVDEAVASWFVDSAGIAAPNALVSG